MGAIFRNLGNDFMKMMFPAAPFPLGTMFVNLVGCFIIGVLNSLLEVKGVISDDMRLFLIVGALGAFTTFSTFSAELFFQLRNGMYLNTILLLSVQLIVGVFAVALGYQLVKWL